MSDLTAHTFATSGAPKIGDAWGDGISEERQGELNAIIAAWDAETDHGERKGPFNLAQWSHEEEVRLKLSGADVFYLAARTLVGTTPLFRRKPIIDLDGAYAAVRDPEMQLSLSFSTLFLAGANLHRADLTDAFLRDAQLNDANLDDTLLTGAYLGGALLDRAVLRGAQLENAYLSNAHLTESVLMDAQLSGADLSNAQLRYANLVRAQLTAANLQGAKLMGAGLFEARLTDADLRLAELDRFTALNGANLAGVSLDQVVFDNTNLAVVPWEGVAPLGDEKHACADTYVDLILPGEHKTREHRAKGYEAAARANRVLATALRTQGLADEADIFAHRAQVMQRKSRLLRRHYARWLVSWGLNALSGYGYGLSNIFVAYGLVLVIFTLIFWGLGVHSFGAEPGWQALWDSFLVSLTAIHGRATFETLGAWTPAAWFAAIESVIGIVIEGVFVAMLIQRLFR